VEARNADCHNCSHQRVVTTGRTVKVGTAVMVVATVALTALAALTAPAAPVATVATVVTVVTEIEMEVGTTVLLSREHCKFPQHRYEIGLTVRKDNQSSYWFGRVEFGEILCKTFAHRKIATKRLSRNLHRCKTT